jgi:peroxiredoxin
MKKIKNLKSMGIALICGVVLFAGRPLHNGYDVGDNAADFKLKNVDGKMVSLSDYKTAKGFIIIFDCNTCPYSKAYNSRIIALNEKYAPQGFPLIAINANDPAISAGDSFDEMVKVAREKGYDFPYLVDESQTIAKAYGATNTPHVFVLDKNSNSWKVAYIGTIDDNARQPSAVTTKYVENAVDALLAGKPVPITRTKALGCGIKWKNI